MIERVLIVLFLVVSTTVLVYIFLVGLDIEMFYRRHRRPKP